MGINGGRREKGCGNKGDNENPNYKSRLAVTEVKHHSSMNICAAMPPPEAIKALPSTCCTKNLHRNKRGPYNLAFIDVSKAYLSAAVKRGAPMKRP